MDGRALISCVALSKGAQLKLDCSRRLGLDDVHVRVNDVLSGISTAHLSNLLSPVFMRYFVYPKTIDLRGPNGAASFHSKFITSIPFSEFSLLPLANIRQFHLDLVHPSCTMPFDHLSFFPAIETFIVSGADLSLLSTLLSNPSASSSLKTLAF